MNRVGMFYGPHDIRVIEQPIPEAGPDDIVIKVAACGICGSDLHGYHHPGLFPPEIILGHEFSGSVFAVGQNVKGLAVGDRVTANPMMTALGVGGSPGAFADYVPIQNAVVGANVFRLPESISDQAAALIEPFSVSQHAVNLIGKRPEDKVAIFGAGPIGLCALGATMACGVKEVVVTDISPLRLAKAKELGASDVFNPRDGDVVEYLAGRHGGTLNPMLQTTVPNTDIIIDCAGIPQTFTDAVSGVRSGGQVLIVASYMDEVTFSPNPILLKEIRLVGSFWAPNEFPQTIDLMSKHRVDMTPIITQRFPLSDINRAFQTQSKPDEAIKVIVTPD